MLGEIIKDYKKYETRLFLCKPDRTTIGELTEAYNKNIVPIYGSIHELTFNIPYVIEKNKEYIRNPHIDLIRGHYLIRYELRNPNDNDKVIDTQYFILTNPKNTFDNGKEIKQVQSYLLPYEFRDKIIRLYKGTKNLQEVLTDTLVAKTNWSIGTIDTKLSTKYRTFDISETNLLDFIYELQEKFNAITIWDTVNRTVSFYELESLGQNRGFEITYGKYLKSLTEDQNFDDVVTRLYCYGQDDLSINSVNPTGADYIDDFSYYMYPFERDLNNNVINHSNYMSDELCHAILDYSEYLENKTGQFADLLSQLETQQTSLDTKSNELLTLNIQLQAIQDNLDIANASGGDTSTYITQKNNKLTEINNKETEIDEILTNITNINSQIATLRNEVSIENHFTSTQIIELNGYIKEKVWLDTTFTDVNDLYNEGKRKLSEISQPQISYSIDIVDFLNVVECHRDWDKLKLGDIVTINYPNFNINVKAKIIKIEHGLDSNDLKLEIANTSTLKNGFMSIKDLLRNSVSTSTQVDMSRFKINDTIDKTTEIDKIINSEFDANKRIISGGINNSISISPRGIIITDPDNPNHMLIAQAGILAISDDGGNTWKHAIRYDGIVAENIVGKLGIFAKVRADQIILGDNGEKLSSSVMGDDLLKANQKYDNSVTFADGNGIKVTDTLNNERVRLGQYAAGKYGLKVTGGEIFSTYIQTNSEGATSYVSIGKDGRGAIEGVENNQKVFSLVAGGGVGNLSLYRDNIETIRFNTNIQNSNKYWNALYSTDNSPIGLFTDNDILLDGRYNSIKLQNDGEIRIMSKDSSGNNKATVVEGNFFATGTMKDSAVETENYGWRGVNAYEMADILFGDIGQAKVVNGECRINLDPIFKETVNTDIPYNVFLTPYANGHIYIDSMEKNGFVVKGDNIPFGWEIKAKRKGCEHLRLEKLDFMELLEDDEILTTNWEDELL